MQKWCVQMQKINTKYLFIIGLCLIGYAVYTKYSSVIIFPYMPTLSPNIIPIIELDKNIYYDEYDKCIKLSEQYNKKLVLVFGAAWCPYCKDLKNDTTKIKQFDNYVVCFIDTDSGGNVSLVQKYAIRSLPTSLVISDGEEESRKSGYKYRDYCEWLDNNKNHGEKTWSEIKF